MKHKCIPKTVLNRHLSQQTYPSTRAKTQTLTSLTAKKKDTEFSLFRMMVALSPAIGICACLNSKNSEANGQKPEVGTLYDCEVTRLDREYALPDPR